jgi:hypothetical protein
VKQDILAAPVDVAMVPFYNDAIRSWREPDGRVYVVLRDPCLALGIDPDGQARRLQRDRFWQRHIHHRQIAVMIGYGATRHDDTLGLDLEYLPMWLASISTNHVKESVQDKLIRYKEECAKVLRDYWFKHDRFWQRHTIHRHLAVNGGYGTRYEKTLGLDLDYLPMWLASISTPWPACPRRRSRRTWRGPEFADYADAIKKRPAG